MTRSSEPTRLVRAMERRREIVVNVEGPDR